MRQELLPARMRCFGLPITGLIALLCAGCAADSAKPGTHCGHCDYRFSYQTPNPCDCNVCGVELPYFGHTPTVWQPWPEHCVIHPPVETLPTVMPDQAAPLTAPPTLPAEPVDPMSGGHLQRPDMANLPSAPPPVVYR
jgi:hypothetical protein